MERPHLRGVSVTEHLHLRGVGDLELLNIYHVAVRWCCLLGVQCVGGRRAYERLRGAFHLLLLVGKIIFINSEPPHGSIKRSASRGRLYQRP